MLISIGSGWWPWVKKWIPLLCPWVLTAPALAFSLPLYARHWVKGFHTLHRSSNSPGRSESLMPVQSMWVSRHWRHSQSCEMAEVSFPPGAPGIHRRALFTFQGLWGNSISVLNIRYNFPQRVRFFCYLNDSQMSCPLPQTYQGELSLDFSPSVALPCKPVPLAGGLVPAPRPTSASCGCSSAVHTPPPRPVCSSWLPPSGWACLFFGSLAESSPPTSREIGPPPAACTLRGRMTEWWAVVMDSVSKPLRCGRWVGKDQASREVSAGVSDTHQPVAVSPSLCVCGCVAQVLGCALRLS